MDQIIRPANLLFLTGVHLSDCTDMADILEERLMEDEIEGQKGGEIITYDKIPSVFTSIETWPINTNLRCWYCTLGFSTMPVFIPKLIGSNGELIPHGVFCLFTCASSYIHERFPIAERWQKMELLKVLFKHFFPDVPVPHEIPCSPKWQSLEIYGGDLPTADYIAQNTEIYNDIFPK